MFDKLMSYLLPSLVKRLANPSQMATIARTALKYIGGFLTGLGFSGAAVAEFQAGNESILAGLLSLGVGLVASAFSAKKKKDK